MTNQPQEQIEDIRKACIEVNDDITKLQFGCHLSVKGRGDYRNTMLFIDHSVAGNLICTPCVKGAGTTTVKHENAEIIGRDIRLDDCRKIIREDYWGELIEMWRDGYLKDQPDVVISWLYENKQ